MYFVLQKGRTCSHNYILKPIPYGLLRMSVYINNFILEKKPSLNLEELKHTLVLQIICFLSRTILIGFYGKYLGCEKLLCTSKIK